MLAFKVTKTFLLLSEIHYISLLIALTSPISAWFMFTCFVPICVNFSPTQLFKPELPYLYPPFASLGTYLKSFFRQESSPPQT